MLRDRASAWIGGIVPFAIPQVSSRRSRSKMKPRRTAKRGWRRHRPGFTHPSVRTAGCAASRSFVALILRVLREEPCRHAIHTDRSDAATFNAPGPCIRLDWRHCAVRDTASFLTKVAKQEEAAKDREARLAPPQAWVHAPEREDGRMRAFAALRGFDSLCSS